MAARQEVENVIVGILADRLKVAGSTIRPDSTIVEELGADSMDLLVFVTTVESRFGIRIGEEQIERVRTVQDVVDALLAQLP